MLFRSATRTYVESIVRYAKSHPENIDKETGKLISVEAAYQDEEFKKIVEAEKATTPVARKQLDLSTQLNRATANMRARAEEQRAAVKEAVREEKTVQDDAEIGDR